MRIIALLLFIPLQIVFLPLAIVGLVLQTYRQIIVSKRLGVSQTAVEPFGGRWTMHLFGMRKDEATMKLARVLPTFSNCGMWLILFPSWVYARIGGKTMGYPRIVEPGAEDIRDLMTARTVYIDAIVQGAFADMEQVVLMGAGYDTRAYGKFRRPGLAFFELDQQTTQTLKRKALREAHIDTGETRFVTVDFARDDALDQLAASGYDPSRKTLFLWEGVTLYLSEADVRRALRDMKAHSTAGSVIVADIYSEKFINIGKKKGLKRTLDYTNEGLNFSLPLDKDFKARLAAFVDSEGLALNTAYFMGTVSEQGPFVVVADIRT
jgi:methyltransferase (TIGR00027 family)